jgi:hypothetical protein
MQISFIYFSNPLGDRSIAEWVSLWNKKGLTSLSSAADIPQDRFSDMEKANFAIVYPHFRSLFNH